MRDVCRFAQTQTPSGISSLLPAELVTPRWTSSREAGNSPGGTMCVMLPVQLKLVLMRRTYAATSGARSQPVSLTSTVLLRGAGKQVRALFAGKQVYE